MTLTPVIRVIEADESPPNTNRYLELYASENGEYLHINTTGDLSVRADDLRSAINQAQTDARRRRPRHCEETSDG
jgi:hypothetical protein